MRHLHYIYSRVLEDRLLLVLLISLPVLLLWRPTPAEQLPMLVDWHTMGILAGLMVLSKGLEDSGALRRAGFWLLTHMPTERRLAVAMVLFSALLSAVVTNDVALFIVVPLTVGLGRVAALPVGRLVVFEALAVNAGSAVSPIGNPQNLYLWQATGDSFVTFFLAMLPVAVWMLGLVLVAVWWAFPARVVQRMALADEGPLHRRLLWVALLSYPLFLGLVEWGFIGLAVGGVMLLFLVLWRRVLIGVDWIILLIFLLMFIVLGLLARLPWMALFAQWLLALPGGEVTAAALLSQVMSNVPAAIFLAEFSADPYLLAWGVNVGGYGLAIGSLANLIALRLSGDPTLWRTFHLWSIPMLLCSVAGALLLR